MKPRNSMPPWKKYMRALPVGWLRVSQLDSGVLDHMDNPKQLQLFSYSKRSKLPRGSQDPETKKLRPEIGPNRIILYPPGPSNVEPVVRQVTVIDAFRVLVGQQFTHTMPAGNTPYVLTTVRQENILHSDGGAVDAGAASRATQGQDGQVGSGVNGGAQLQPPSKVAFTWTNGGDGAAKRESQSENMNGDKLGSLPDWCRGIKGPGVKISGQTKSTADPPSMEQYTLTTLDKRKVDKKNIVMPSKVQMRGANIADDNVEFVTLGSSKILP